MKICTLLCLILLSSQVVKATHLLGGYMQAKPVAGSSLTYQITVALYMDEGRGKSVADQSDALQLCFGDGTTGTAYRQSRILVTGNTMSINSYTIVHTYAGPSTYALTASLSNRTTVKNIPNADGQLFTLSTTISTNTTTLNQTPTPGFPTASFHVGVNQKVTLPLKATDTEGDSIVYGIAKPLTNTSSEPCGQRLVPNYVFPNDLTRRGTFKLNNRTGDLVWDAPAELGYYSIALHIDEYRNGILISQTTQEIVLVVDDLPGTPGIFPPYEPAIEGVFGGIVTATSSYADSDITLTTFPNPVDDRLQVVIQTSNPTTATIQLLDANGRKLHELAFNRLTRQHEQVISMDSLTPGVYLLRANVGGRLLFRKIVKR